MTGFITAAGAGRPELQATGQRMSEPLRHRGPDGQGLWMDEAAGIVLAHRRLSILDLSPGGAQPMQSASGRYVIVFNGEIYNYATLRPTLEARNYPFKGRSDTEVLLASIEIIGLNQTLQQINGMFAFAVWDKKTRTLHVARDRFGKKPLYIGWAGNDLIFGSELKALRAHPGFVPAIDPAARALYLKFGYVPAPHSIYKNIWTLPPGHRLSVHTEPLVTGEYLPDLMEPYWNHLRALEEASARVNPRAGEDETIEEFSNIFHDCVRDRLVSDVPLGAFLSGGIDSSAVVAAMQELSSTPVKTYTIGFHEQGFDEAAHARKVADHLGTDHHELYLSAKNALDVIPLLPSVYDEPFADISAIPTYLVANFARRDVAVALTGDGGDEMLGGYNRHTEAPRIWNKSRLVPAPLRRIAGRALQSIPQDRWNNLAVSRPQFGSGVHKAAAILTLDTQEQVHDYLAGQNADHFLLDRLMPHTLLDAPAWQPRGLSFAEKMMYRDVLSYLPNGVLLKVDRATMAVSLEARAPLLDWRLYDYAWSLPMKYKIRGRTGKWLLRAYLKTRIPAEYYDRPKQGFSMPVAEWLRGPLRDWAESLLAPDALDSALDQKKISSAWNDHLAGRGNHAGQLWTVLMFEAWRRQWL